VKRDLFIKLIKELNDNDFNNMISSVVQPNELKKIMDLTEGQIKDFLNTDNNELKVVKLYLYLKKEQLSSDVKEILEKNLRNQNSNIYFALGVIEKFKSLGRNDVIDFIKVIELSDKTYQGMYASVVARDENVLQREDAIEFVKAILNSKWYYQAEYASVVATNPKVLKLDNAIEFVDRITKASSIYASRYASEITTDNNLLQKESAIDIIEIITSTKEHYQAYISSKISTNVNLLAHRDIKEIVKLVATAKGKYQAEQVHELLKNKYILSTSDLLENIRLLTTAKTEEEAQKIKMEVLYSANNSLVNKSLNSNISFEEKTIKELIINNDFDNLIESLELYRDDDITLTTKVKVKIKNNKKQDIAH